VKIHQSTTPVDDERNDPKVCVFYLDAFHFDTVQRVTWTISQQPPTGRARVSAGKIVLHHGTGHTSDMTLPDGHYKLSWTFKHEHGSAKHKVFMVDCASPSPTPTPTPSASPSSGPTTPPNGHGHGPGGPGPGGTPIGGVGAGGGGSFHSPDPAEQAAGAVLATAGLATAGLVLLRRRRAAKRP